MIEIKQEKLNGLTALDLFCGAGVGAYGIKKAGYDILYAVDNDKDAVDTYNLNIGNHAVCEDIRKVDPNYLPEVDLVIATPVCKPFSVCGARRLTKDKKYGDLLSETVRIFSALKPKALFFENVAGIAIGDSLPIFIDFCKYLESYGYHTYWDIVNSFDLGVPQQRERVFLVAIRDDIPYEFVHPKKVMKRTTQRDAIYDLRDKTIEDVKNHNTNRFKIYPNFSVNMRQCDWDEPSKTVLSHKDAVLVYPEPKLILDKQLIKKYSVDLTTDTSIFPRKMSVREHLRLQTVGDDFYFPDNVSLNEQYNRCSGVPSLVAYKYGKAIEDCLLGRTPKRISTIKYGKKLF